MTTKEEYEAVLRLRQEIEGEMFQKYLVKPIYKEMETLKASYDCSSLRELATQKGKKQGLDFLLKLLKIVNEDFNKLTQELKEQN